MKHSAITSVIGFAIASASFAEPISIKDDLMYSVNPPRKVFPEKPATPTIRLIQAPPPLPKPDPASRGYIDSVKIWNAAQALVRDGKKAEAIAIMENASERLQTIQRDYPDFEPLYVKRLASTISKAIASNTENTAEQGAAANP